MSTTGVYHLFTKQARKRKGQRHLTLVSGPSSFPSFPSFFWSLPLFYLFMFFSSLTFISHSLYPSQSLLLFHFFFLETSRNLSHLSFSAPTLSFFFSSLAPFSPTFFHKRKIGIKYIVCFFSSSFFLRLVLSVFSYSWLRFTCLSPSLSSPSSSLSLQPPPSSASLLSSSLSSQSA